ncbi:hypothetical protein BT63DRAFT_422237 [Microthyrium microscopicum]|uniref:Uncharacterized protein n=1 Tax=Microthyrium microscopicum TaxID=703497 RepID=A0A6A6UHE9_9PEZI|nr:hypothetical protein BT63DRAFT_422237 [Microthyrium microscopicum]
MRYFIITLLALSTAVFAGPARKRNARPGISKPTIFERENVKRADQCADIVCWTLMECTTNSEGLYCPQCVYDGDASLPGVCSPDEP